MRTAPSRSAKGWWRRVLRPGCASAAIGIRVAVSRSTCSGRPALRLPGCGCPTRESPPIVAAADPHALTQSIKDQALALGFAEVRITGAEDVPGVADDLAAYLADGRHGEMGWMEGTADRRASPTAQWAEARSVIMVGDNYGPGEVGPLPPDLRSEERRVGKECRS